VPTDLVLVLVSLLGFELLDSIALLLDKDSHARLARHDACVEQRLVLLTLS